MLNCRICNKKTIVVNTRSYDGGTKVRRRRECVSCHNRFTTIESEIPSKDDFELENLDCDDNQEEIYSILQKYNDIDDEEIYLDYQIEKESELYAAFLDFFVKVQERGAVEDDTMQNLSRAMCKCQRGVPEELYSAFADLYAKIQDLYSQKDVSESMICESINILSHTFLHLYDDFLKN